jgi:hypothetical protein
MISTLGFYFQTLFYTKIPLLNYLVVFVLEELYLNLELVSIWVLYPGIMSTVQGLEVGWDLDHAPSWSNLDRILHLNSSYYLQLTGENMDLEVLLLCYATI